jgi:hypothetical protein
LGWRRAANLSVAAASEPSPPIAPVGAFGMLDFSKAANSGLLLLLFDDI